MSNTIDESKPELRREQRRSKQKRKTLKDRALYRYRWEIALSLLLLAGIGFLVNPWRLWVAAHVVDGNLPLSLGQQLSNWFVYNGGTAQVGLVVLALGLFGLGRQLIWRANHTASLWRRHGCPNCEGNDLKRVHRTAGDRLLNGLGVQVRRYICADCRWQGRRVDDGRL